MKQNIKAGSVEIKQPAVRLKRSLIKRISPFLLLSIFLVFYLFYAMITNTATTANYIAFPFIIANSFYIDVALWNYFKGKKKGTIWIIESLITVLITYWTL